MSAELLDTPLGAYAIGLLLGAFAGVLLCLMFHVEHIAR